MIVPGWVWEGEAASGASRGLEAGRTVGAPSSRTCDMKMRRTVGTSSRYAGCRRVVFGLPVAAAHARGLLRGALEATFKKSLPGCRG